MTNRPVIRWLTMPAKIEHDHEHEMILAQDVRYETPNSAGSSDPGQMFEQGRPHAKRMILMGDHYRELSGFRVVADERIVRYTD